MGRMVGVFKIYVIELGGGGEAWERPDSGWRDKGVSSAHWHRDGNKGVVRFFFFFFPLPSEKWVGGYVL